MKLMRFSALPLALVLALGACTDEKGSTTEVDASIAGTYRLQTVGGNPLPYTVSTIAGVTRSILSRTITVDADGSFTQETTFREFSTTSDVTTTETVSGSVGSTGSVLTFNLPAHGSSPSTLITATYTSGNLTFGTAGGAQVYTRQ